MNHLSCEEARVLYGGCVSLIPLLFDQIQKIQSELRAKEEATLESSSALQKSWPPPRRAASAAVRGHQRSKTDSKFKHKYQNVFKPWGREERTHLLLILFSHVVFCAIYERSRMHLVSCIVLKSTRLE